MTRWHISCCFYVVKLVVTYSYDVTSHYKQVIHIGVATLSKLLYNSCGQGQAPPNNQQ